MLCIAVSANTFPLERSELLFAVQGEVKNKILDFGSKAKMKQAKYPMDFLRKRRLNEIFISNYKTLSFGQGNVLTALPIFSDLVGF